MEGVASLPLYLTILLYMKQAYKSIKDKSMPFENIKRFDSEELCLKHIKFFSDYIIKKFTENNVDNYKIIALSSVANEYLMNNVKKDMITDLNLISYNNLPLNIKAQLDEIKNISSEINIDLLDNNQKNKLNILNKKLPEAIKEYCFVSTDYLEKLGIDKNQPEQILLDSLNEIKEKLTEIVLNKTNHSVREMKITNKFLKNL